MPTFKGKGLAALLTGLFIFFSLNVISKRIGFQNISCFSPVSHDSPCQPGLECGLWSRQPGFGFGSLPSRRASYSLCLNFQVVKKGMVIIPTPGCSVEGGLLKGVRRLLFFWNVKLDRCWGFIIL